MAIIRYATPNDVSAIYNVVTQSEIFSNLTLEDVIEIVNNKSSLVYVNDTEIVGFVSYRKLLEDGSDNQIIHNKPSDAFIIDILAVLTEYRGFDFGGNLISAVISHVSPDSLYVLGRKFESKLYCESSLTANKFKFLKSFSNYNGLGEADIYILD